MKINVVIYMVALTDKEFKDFIESFKGGHYKESKKGELIIHNFYDSITELSRSETEKADALIENSFEMYALDWICKNCRNMKGNTPSTTDAIFCKEEPNGKLVLHLIEFKFLSKTTYGDKLEFIDDEIMEKNRKARFSKQFLNYLKDIKEDFKDNIEFTLRLKPFETIFIVLPRLYDNYCKEEGITKKDIRTYLNNIDIKYWVFLGNKSDNESHVQAMANILKKPYLRLEMGIVKKAQVKPKSYFDTFMDVEIYGKRDFLDEELI